MMRPIAAPIVDLRAIDERPGVETKRSRNPRVGDVFRDMQLAENRGTGVRMMRREMEKAGLPPPEFVSSREHDTFMTVLRLPGCTAQTTPHVTPHVGALLEKLVGERSRPELQEALGLSDREAGHQTKGRR